MAVKKILFVFPRVHFNLIDTLIELTKYFKINILNFKKFNEIEQVGYSKINKVKSHNLKLAKMIWLINSEFFFPNPIDLWNKISGYDFIIFKNLYDPTSLLGMFFCRIRNIPFIFSEQKINEPKYGIMQYLFLAVKNLYIKGLLQIHTIKAFSPTKIGFNQLSEYTKKRFYIPFAIDIKNKPQKNFENKKNIINILNISRFVPRKDQLLLLKAVKSLQDSNKNVFFTITLVGGVDKGDTYLQDLKLFTKENNLNVNFIEKVPRDKMEKVFLEADIFVLSSYDEPAAYSHLEAMSYGLPVICSDENGTQNYIERGFNGAVFRVHDVKSLTNELKSIIISKGNINWSKIEKFGQKSREIAVKNHSPEVIVKKFERMLK